MNMETSLSYLFPYPLPSCPLPYPTLPLQSTTPGWWSVVRGITREHGPVGVGLEGGPYLLNINSQLVSALLYPGKGIIVHIQYLDYLSHRVAGVSHCLCVVVELLDHIVQS